MACLPIQSKTAQNAVMNLTIEDASDTFGQPGGKSCKYCFDAPQDSVRGEGERNTFARGIGKANCV